MDAIDREILNAVQKAIPLVPRPFAALGRALGLSEEEVLSRIQRLKEDRIIRQIGPIFSSRRLGYRSTLAAFHVEGAYLEDAAALISAHAGVSHNYSRNHHYNLWFTLTLPQDEDLGKEIARLARAASVGDYLNLPSLRRFKIGVHFDMSDRSNRPDRERRANKRLRNGKDDAASPRAEGDKGERSLTGFERDVVRVLQGDLPLVTCPFRDAAARLDVTEARLLAVARDMDQRGIMRRFSAVLKHRRAGFTANGMGCWVVPEERIIRAGQAAAAFQSVSHCYQRPAYPPRWPYNLFTMVHGQTQEAVERIAGRIRDEIDPLDDTILYSQKEYKKERVRYFVNQSID